MPPASMAHVKYSKHINNVEEEIGSVATAVVFLPLYSKIRQCGPWKSFFHFRILFPQAGQRVPNRYGALKCNRES